MGVDYCLFDLFHQYFAQTLIPQVAANYDGLNDVNKLLVTRLRDRSPLSDSSRMTDDLILILSEEKEDVMCSVTRDSTRH